MTEIKDQLASVLGRSDEIPNIALAEKIVKAKDHKAVASLMLLTKDKRAPIRSDAIKVLYEIGERDSSLIRILTGSFIEMLRHKDNRMIWGAMSALSTISRSNPELLTDHITEIVDAMDSGSVITRDRGVHILAHLTRLDDYRDDCLELLLEQVQNAPINQMPMYAEMMTEVATPVYTRKLRKVIFNRKDVMEIPSKKKRLEKLLRQLDSL